MIIEDKVQWVRSKKDHEIYKVISLSLVTNMIAFQKEKVQVTSPLDMIREGFEWAENIGDWKEFEL